MAHDGPGHLVLGNGPPGVLGHARLAGPLSASSKAGRLL
jgi:hypothetical protein